jgi:glycosyltransferase involved in cell wall biosynthesis
MLGRLSRLPFFMRVSVIIPTFNQRDRLHRCLELLHRQTLQPSEIIVIDNNSNEDIASLCAAFPLVQYCQESKQGSYAARNRGIAISTGEILAFTDADCLPMANWLESGVNALRDVDLVAGEIQFCFRSNQPSVIEYVDALSHLRQRDYAQEGYSATGNMFTWRESFQRVGLFRDDLLSLGDREWGLRLSEAGGKVVYSPDAIVLHPARTSLRELLQKIRLQAIHQHKLKPYQLRHFLNQVLPLGLQFWRTVWRDPKLRRWEKLRFAWVIHRVKWAIAGVMVRYLTIRN